jgi:tRNA dimethylallyltransferase
MLEAGLVPEVVGLLARGLSPGLRPLRAIGYRQAVRVAQGQMSVDEARGEIVTETMRYAKRQMTWFRHQTRVLWCETQGEAGDAARAWLEGERTAASMLDQAQKG